MKVTQKAVGFYVMILIACCFLTMVATKSASAATYRNIYGYIFGPAIQKGDVTSITLYDDTAGGSRNLWDTLKYDFWAGGLRYYSNHLPTNHQYHIIVVFNYDNSSVRRDFYLPSGYSNDQKIADVRYRSN